VYRILRLCYQGEPETGWEEFLRRYPGAADLLGVPR
jgi:hypothetical protein